MHLVNVIKLSLVRRYVFVIFWIVIIITLSLLPKSSIDIGSVKLFKGTDKVVHFLMYFILMILWIFSVVRLPKDKRVKKIFIGVVFSVSLGLILEILQKYLEIGRTFDTFDIIANISGIVFVMIFLKNKIIKDEF